jgi:hypothetical protein
MKMMGFFGILEPSEVNSGNLETGFDFFSIVRVGFFFGLLSAGEDILNWKISTGMSFGAIEEVFPGILSFLSLKPFLKPLAYHLRSISFHSS